MSSTSTPPTPPTEPRGAQGPFLVPLPTKLLVLPEPSPEQRARAAESLQTYLDAINAGLPEGARRWTPENFHQLAPEERALGMAVLERWLAETAPADEPDWDVDVLFPPGHAR